MIKIQECSGCKYYMSIKFAGKPFKMCANPESEYASKILLPSFCCEKYVEISGEVNGRLYTHHVDSDQWQELCEVEGSIVV